MTEYGMVNILELKHYPIEQIFTAPSAFITNIGNMTVRFSKGSPNIKSVGTTTKLKKPVEVKKKLDSMMFKMLFLIIYLAKDDNQINKPWVYFGDHPKSESIDLTFFPLLHTFGI